MTRWTWVRGAQQGDEETSEIALNELCSAYWYPLYITGRRKRALSHHEAEDLTQGFWIWLLDKGHLADARPEKGKFRNVLAGYFDNYVRNELRKESAKKRGGDVSMISRDDTLKWERRFEAEMGKYPSPDEHLDAAWRRAHLEAAFNEVEANWVRRGKGEIYNALKEHLKSGAERGGYRPIAETLGLTEANVRQFATSLRKDLKAARAKWLEE